MMENFIYIYTYNMRDLMKLESHRLCMLYKIQFFYKTSSKAMNTRTLNRGNKFGIMIHGEI